MARTRLATLAEFFDSNGNQTQALQRIVLLSLAALVPMGLNAQTTSTTERDEQREEVVRLSPFEVVETEDVGYRATNTTSGTSLNTAIKDLPMTIQVVTSEFMTDIGDTDFT